jgi:diguanylate cyclase (GGDEF)-like protein/PAS domain S-box-containing protein
MAETPDPETFRVVLESLHLGICLENRERKIVFWNDGAERISGFRRHEVVGHSCREGILSECNDDVCVLCSGSSCPFQRSLQDGKARETYIQARHHDGHRIPLRISVIPIRDSPNAVAGITVSFDQQRFVSERERRQYGLSAHGCLDHITGIANHSFTLFHLRENLAGFTQYHLPFSIMRIRVDQLDQFRAKYGREAADAILRVVAQTLQNSLRPNDLLGRWEEDEFVAILLNCSAGGLAKVAERVGKVAHYAGIQWWGDHLSVTVSIGYAAAQTEDTIELLLERALQSLKRGSAKRMAAAAEGGGVPPGN